MRGAGGCGGPETMVGRGGTTGACGPADAETDGDAGADGETLEGGAGTATGREGATAGGAA